MSSAKAIRVGRKEKADCISADGFKNPILGLEINLIKQLQAVDSNSSGVSFQKRKILLDALQNLADTNLGYKKPLERAISCWRPKLQNTNNSEFAAVSNLLSSQEEYKEARLRLMDQAKINETLTDELKQVEEETERLNLETRQMRERLYNQSDHFSHVRKLSGEMHSLKKAFDEMFIVKSNEDDVNDRFKEISDENDQLRTQLATLKFELEICSQINKRLGFNDQKDPASIIV